MESEELGLTMESTVNQNYDSEAKIISPRKVVIFQVSGNWGGVEKFIRDVLCEVFSCDDVIIMGDSHSESQRYKIPTNCTLKNMPSLLHFLSYLKFIKLCICDADIVYFNKNSAINIIPILTAKIFSSARIVVHSHNTRTTLPIFFGWIHYLFRPLLNKVTDISIACSTDAAHYLFGQKSQTAHIVGNGIDVMSFRFSPRERRITRQILGVGGDTYVVGNIGRLCRRKNQEFVIQVFREFHFLHSDSVLLIIGEGEREKRLRYLVSKYELESAVIFLGFRDDVPNLLSAMDCYLFPSLYEGYPFAIMEAQTSGLAVYASDTITKDVNLIGKVKYFSLNDGPTKWSFEMERNIHSAKLCSDRLLASIQIQEKDGDVSTSIKRISQILKL